MKIFNSNTKKLSRVVPKTNINKIEGATFADKLVNDFKQQNETFSGSFTSVENYDYETSFDSRAKKTFNSKNITYIKYKSKSKSKIKIKINKIKIKIKKIINKIYK